jgi:hypothetical protein
VDRYLEAKYEIQGVNKEKLEEAPQKQPVLRNRKENTTRKAAQGKGERTSEPPRLINLAKAWEQLANRGSPLLQPTGQEHIQRGGTAMPTLQNREENCRPPRNKMLAHDYTRRHNEVVRSIHLLMANKYGSKRSRKVRIHSVQEVMANERAEIRVDTRVKTDIKVQNNRPGLFVLDKRNNEITIIEVGITSQDQLQKVEAEKYRKYDLLAKELGILYKCRTRIIPHVMTWDGMVTNFHRRYQNDLEITPTIEAYRQSRVLNTTLEAISFEKRWGILDGYTRDDETHKAVERLGIAAIGTTEA